MKKVLFGIGGLILGAMLGSAVWFLSSVILLPLLQGLITLGMAAGGAYLGYTYAKREELPPSDWKS